MPEAKTFVVGWSAHSLADVAEKKGSELLAIGKSAFPATSIDAAMQLAIRRVPHLILRPGCLIRIRYCKEKK